MVLAMLFVVMLFTTQTFAQDKNTKVIISNPINSSPELGCYGTWYHSDGSAFTLYKNNSWDYEDVDGATASGTFTSGGGSFQLFDNKGRTKGYFDCGDGHLQIYIGMTTYGGMMHKK